MLEFLGLEDEAIKVVISFIILGAVLGVQAGILSANTNSDEKKVKVGSIVFLVICILAGAYAFLSGILPAIALFFTFQWKALLGGLFQGSIVAAVTFWIGNRAVIRSRRKKYMRNPIVKETVAYCKQNDIVGIQCFDDRLRFFKKLEDPNYCKTSINKEKKENAAQALEYQKNWSRPECFVAYDYPLSLYGTLKFRDRDYPNLPDLPMFASVLARKLGGFGYATHYHSVQYDTVAYGAGTKTTTHHITVLHSDCFVYKRKAYREKKKAWKELGLNKKPEKPTPVKKNTWE